MRHKIGKSLKTDTKKPLKRCSKAFILLFYSVLKLVFRVGLEPTTH